MIRYMEVIRIILEKYQDTYTKFITKYEEIPVNHWHNIIKEIYQKLITTTDINDKYNFIYFMNYIIKRLSGTNDAHTKLCINLPYYFLPKTTESFIIDTNSILKNYLKKEQYDIMNMRVKWRNKNDKRKTIRKMGWWQKTNC